MADYDNIAELRRALSADSPDRRANAYGDVMAQDVQPSQILETPPDSAAVQTLVEAGVVADEDTGNQGPPASDRWARIEELLETIAANTGGGS